MKLMFQILLMMVCVGAGWIIGSKHAAPPVVLQVTDHVIVATQDKISEALSAYEENEVVIEQKAVEISKPDDVVVVSEGEIFTVPKALQQETQSTLKDMLYLCKMANVNNAPLVDENRLVLNYRPLFVLDGIEFATMPVPDACISSGHGRRNGKLHKGIDYYSRKGGPIFAAADGQILEAEYRDDYGFTVLLNHGNGYYTRYAHLGKFADGVVIGAAVPRGFTLGPMGQTAVYAVPKHLHFELLQGDYDNPKKSFGLSSVNLFDLL